MIKKLSILIVAASLAACAGNKPKDEAPTNEPPTGAEADVAMPKGAPVVEPDDPNGEDEPVGDGETVSEGPEGEEVASESDGPTVTRDDFKAFLDKGAPYVLTIVTVEPVHGDSGLTGWQIVEVTRGAREFMMPQMRVGDVVTHVNGVRILKPDDLMKAWRSLQNADSVRVDYLRQGNPEHALWGVE